LQIFAVIGVHLRLGFLSVHAEKKSVRLPGGV
jgi:hypothetical protein